MLIQSILLPVLRLSPHSWDRMMLLYWHLGPRRRRANIVTWAEAAWARTARLLAANNLREASQWAVQGQCFGSCFSFDNTWATWPDTWLATVYIKGDKYFINWLLTCQEPHVHSHVTRHALYIHVILHIGKLIISCLTGLNSSSSSRVLVWPQIVAVSVCFLLLMLIFCRA